MNELLENLERLENKLASARTILDDTPQMLDPGPYLASYDILTYENQGTLNPDWQAACDAWIETTNEVVDALVQVLDAGEYSILPSWSNHSDKEHREIAKRAIMQLSNYKTISALVDQARLQHPEEIKLLITVGQQKGTSALANFIASDEPEFSLALSKSIKSCYLDSKLGSFMYGYYGNIRCAIVSALITIGDPAIDALLSALDKFQILPNRLGLTIYVLGALGNAKAVEPLTMLSSHPNRSVSSAVRDALARINGSH